MEFRELLELFKNGKYEEVISHVEEINDYNAIFLLLRSYIALNKYFDAIKTYQKFREVLENNNLIESIKVYLYLLVETGADDTRLQKEIDYFQDKNYVNQETEEFLCELNKYIEAIKDNRKTFEKYSIEEVIEMLKSDDEHLVFAALSEIIHDDKYRKIDLMPTIAKILEERNVMDITYGMLLDTLVVNKYSCSLMFKNNGHYYKINPSDYSELNLKQDKLLSQALSHIQSNEKNISIGEFVMKTMVKYSYQLAPKYLTNISELSSFVVACYRLASLIFKVTLNDDQVLSFYSELMDKNLTNTFLEMFNKNFQIEH